MTTTRRHDGPRRVIATRERVTAESLGWPKEEESEQPAAFNERVAFRATTEEQAAICLGPDDVVVLGDIEGSSSAQADPANTQPMERLLVERPPAGRDQQNLHLLHREQPSITVTGDGITARSLPGPVASVVAVSIVAAVGGLGIWSALVVASTASNLATVVWASFVVCTVLLLAAQLVPSARR